jgi:hypothetical protein
MYQHTAGPLTIETLMRDPLTRLVMDADGVSITEFAAVMYAARDALAARGAYATRVVAMPLAASAGA